MRTESVTQPALHSTMLISYCCHKKLTQIYQFKTTPLYCYSSGGQKSKINFTSLRSRCQQGWAPSGGGEESLSPFSF